VTQEIDGEGGLIYKCESSHQIACCSHTSI
jgi:hypothetical protein